MRSIDIVTIGDGASGKTALLLAMQQTDFKFENAKGHIHDIQPTACAGFEVYKVNFKLHGDDVTVNLHDTAGQEDYDRLRPLSYGLGIDVVFLVFAVISPDSFENIEDKWIPEINHHLKNVLRILVGTRSDILQVADQSVHIQPMISKQVELPKGFKKSAFKKKPGYKNA